MKGTVKSMVKGIIAGVIIIIIGAAIMITGLALSGWKIEGGNFEMQTFTAESDNSALNIDIGAGTLVTEFYDGDKVVIEYPVAKNYVTEVGERDGGVYYNAKFKWYVFLGNYDIPNTVVKLPNGVDFKIDIDIDAGTVRLADGRYSEVSVDINAGTFKANAIECSSLKCDMSAGTVKIDAVTCNTTAIEVSAGTANLGFTGDKSEYGITAKVSAGSCNVDGQTGSTDKTINVKVSAGTVKLSFNV